MSNKLWQLLTKETPAGTRFKHCNSNYVYEWNGNTLQTVSEFEPLLQKLLFDEWEIILKEKSFDERLNEMTLSDIMEHIRIACKFGVSWGDNIPSLLLHAILSLGTKYPELRIRLWVKNNKGSYLVCEIVDDVCKIQESRDNCEYTIAHAIARYCYQKGLIK